MSIELGVVAIEGFEASLDLSSGTTRSTKSSKSSSRECRDRHEGSNRIWIVFRDECRC
jgi:hypothetical protein